MTPARIQTTVQDFTKTAVLAQQAGYDGVEIMGSEGYLLCQFLSPRTNLRKDAYGGSLQNRMKFPLEIVQAVRAATRPSFIIIFRISLLDLVEGGSTFDEMCQFARALEEAGVTILNTGIGWHEARVPTIAPCVPRGAYAFVTKRFKDANVVKIPMVCTNRINMPQTAEHLLSDGTSDLVSMARPLLADPQFIQKAANQQAHMINTCIACNQACLDHAFEAKTASCLVNPRACHETQMMPVTLSEVQRLNICVVGAGPAGCAFAITAADLGHSVTLYEQDKEIGGQFLMAKRIPGKEEFHETLRYFTNQLKSKGVSVKLNTKISYEDMKKASSVDKWIVSTGVDPRDPNIPGAHHPNVLSYVDVLKHSRPVGRRVAIIGAGGIGFDVAEFLLYHEQDKTAQDLSNSEFYKEWGIDDKQKERGGLVERSPRVPKREIHLLQRKKGKLGAYLGKTTGWIHRASLKAGNVKTINGVVYDRIDDEGCLHFQQEGNKHVLEVDTIVLCAGQVEQNELYKAAEVNPEFDSKVYTIGGAFQAGELDAKRAIDNATRLAFRIHEKDVVPGRHIFESPVGPEEALTGLLLRFI
jgi:2,4-dienoyl-CoA reductase (NADPH2)